MANIFDLAPDYCPMGAVSASVVVITRTVEPCTCHTGLPFLFSLLAVIVHVISSCPPCRFRSDVAKKPSLED